MDVYVGLLPGVERQGNCDHLCNIIGGGQADDLMLVGATSVRNPCHSGHAGCGPIIHGRAVGVNVYHTVMSRSFCQIPVSSGEAGEAGM